MKNAHILTTILTLASTTALAQNAPVSLPVTTDTPLKDVPSTHWASEAVNLLISKGIIMGYPDGTFGGNRPITRYELSLILARVISQNLLATKTAQSTLTPQDLTVIANGIKEVADQLATMDVRLRDALTDIDSIKARLTSTEQALQQVVKVAVTQTELEATTTKITTDTTTALNTKADAATVTTLQGQVDTLNKTVADQATQLKSAQDSIQTLQTTADDKKQVQPSSTEQAALEGAAKINGQVYTDPMAIPNATFKPDKYSDQPFYVGGGVNFPPASSLGYGIVLGSERLLPLLDGLGLRGSASYHPKARAYSLQANLTKAFGNTADGTNKFSPYIGLGGGVLVSPQRVNTTAAANDSFVSALAGVNYNFTDTLRLYAEFDGRYFLSGKGLATGFSTDRKGAAFNLATGLKVYF